MIEIRKTPVFAKWLDSLSDPLGRARVLARIDRLASGNPGDVKTVGAGVLEMRIDTGPGYRVYYTMKGRTLVVLLAGGSKRSQSKDIKKALALAKGLQET